MKFSYIPPMFYDQKTDYSNLKAYITVVVTDTHFLNHSFSKTGLTINGFTLIALAR